MEHLHPDDRPRVFRALLEHLTARTLYDVEYRLRTKSGEYRWFSGRAHAQWDDEGTPVRLAGAIRDITDRKRMEAAVQNDQRLLRQLLEVHERERQLFAYEIHDGLIQQITAAKMHLEAHGQCAGNNVQRAAHELELGLGRLRDAVDDARRLLSGLRPPILDEAGVIAAIEYLANEQRGPDREVVFQHEVSFRRLAPPLESAIFRIVQEALANSRRHSKARSVRIVLAARDGNLRLEITDDGIGFAHEQVGDASFGLRGIRERARLLGGGATITSEPGKGARVTVEFPLPAEAEEWS
jgi:signal transduction histidine kinase